MHRLFVAIRPPAAVRAFLIMQMGSVAAARWQSDDQLHLTLRFIGDADRNGVRDIGDALNGIRHRPFDLAVRGLGMFDKKGAPHTLWAGVSPPEPVAALHTKVDQALVRVGFPPDGRAFHPHITLARLNRAAGPLDDYLARSGTVAGPHFRVDAFGLFESQLTSGGAVYSQIESYRLA